jgi:hypothetical protein
VLKLKGGGTREPVFRENENGILDDDPGKDGHGLVENYAALYDSGASDLDGMFGLRDARTVAEGMACCQKLRAASFNWLLADRGGNIGYQMSGAYSIYAGLVRGRWEGRSEGDGRTWTEWRLARMNPRPSTCKRSHNEPSVGRPRPCGGALGLLEQLDLAGRLEAGDAAKVGRRPRLSEAERLGPRVLVAAEALDALAVADQGAQLHAPPAMRAGVDGQAQGQAHQLGPGPVAAARSGSGRLGRRLGVRLRGGRSLSFCPTTRAARKAD